MRSRFRAVATNRSAATQAQAFLARAGDDETTHTRVFVVGGEIAGFYALSVGEALVSSRTRSSLRARSNRIPTAHIDWIARHREAPAGTGRILVEHAIAVVEQDLQPVTPIMGLSLDAFDAKTASAAWKPFGFIETKSDGHGTVRMFLPLRGYGPVGLKRST